jgi:hypothetical protein
VDAYNITYPVGKEDGIAGRLGVKVLPETVFIAEDGIIVKRHRDTIDYKGLVSGIEAILK